jgi:hypothetical protein
MKRVFALLLSAALAAPACATTGTTGAVAAPGSGFAVANQSVLAEYVQRIPLGSPVLVQFTNGKEMRGTLMKATGQNVFVQPKTRIPEPPLEIPLTEVMGVALEPKKGNSVAKSIAIGAAVGVGAAVGFILILVAALD